ncbi:MAG: sulfatase-like hydrolase/transferase, partial [Verrucomicrobiota bacterium]
MLSVIVFVLAGFDAAMADPRIYSWFTDRSGVYARVYETPADEIAQNAVTTWSRGAGTQALPTYAGINEICYTADWVYIRSTNLASHIMGPWGPTGNFPNFPANLAVSHRFPRNPANATNPAYSPPSSNITGGGDIGRFVNGVAMFDSRDAFTYDADTMTEQRPQNGGDGAWNRDAYVNESPTFDSGNAHQANANYHYHANPPGLRWELGDSVDYDETTNVYTENFNGGHSPIIGWCDDGLPIYGPYGFSDPTDPASDIRRMISGFQLRTDMNADSLRDSWPAWATRIYASTTQTFVAGPNVDASYPLGRYLEDNDFKGDLGFTQYNSAALGAFNDSNHYDLNEYNVRFCVTPEFPGGTWAYFTCVAADGTPVFPYNIGRSYFLPPVAGAPDGVPDSSESGATVTMHFEGGPEKTEIMESLSVDDLTGDVTIAWSGIEGGTYEIVAATNPGAPDPWTPIVSGGIAAWDKLDAVDPAAYPGTSSRKFYKFRRTDLAEFDDNGFNWAGFPPPPLGGVSTITITVPNAPNNLANLPLYITFDVGGTNVSIDLATVVRPSRFELSFDVDLTGLGIGTYNVEYDFDGPAGVQITPFEIRPNILFFIVDDWSRDMSPIDNTVPPGAVLPVMPHLEDLAANGLQFTRAFVNPACSPTRASFMTGRLAHQTGVWTPNVNEVFSNPAQNPQGNNEFALPEAFTAAGSPYALVNIGKWHLGGGDTGYSDRGGWPEFYGITGGGTGDYDNWDKNTNGTSSTETTYSTVDQVVEARDFMNRSHVSGQPFLCWVAFNAPHSPWQDPETEITYNPEHGEPASLIPAGGYSSTANTSNTDKYIRMCETLDHLIGWLFDEMDAINPVLRNNTNIILIGDNGTPGQIVQAPFGDGHSKGDLYNGGTNVPMVVQGPAVAPGLVNTQTDKLVHATDFYATLMELAGIDPASVPGIPADALAQSNSFVSVLSGTDTADRCLIAEGGALFGRYRVVLGEDADRPGSISRFAVRGGSVVRVG